MFSCVSHIEFQIAMYNLDAFFFYSTLFDCVVGFGFRQRLQNLFIAFIQQFIPWRISKLNKNEHFHNKTETIQWNHFLLLSF